MFKLLTYLILLLALVFFLFFLGSLLYFAQGIIPLFPISELDGYGKGKVIGNLTGRLVISAILFFISRFLYKLGKRYLPKKSKDHDLLDYDN